MQSHSKGKADYDEFCIIPVMLTFQLLLYRSSKNSRGTFRNHKTLRLFRIIAQSGREDRLQNTIKKKKKRQRNTNIYKKTIKA
jgi:hypothetical protein